MRAHSGISTRQVRSSDGRGWLAIVALGSVLAVVSAMLSVAPAFASSVTSATFTGGAGTVSSGGTLYAKQGGALTLTVITSSDTKCVDVAGAFTAHSTSATAKSSWTFTTTAGTGDGAQAVTAAASPNVNGQDKCTGPSSSLQASFTLDNTGPVVTAALAPAANAAGWNKANVGITWSATDAGSGIGSGPTPATDSVNSNTASVTKNATATDKLGNSGSGAVVVKLDKTNPTVTGSAAPAANGFGWNNSNVTVSFVCADALSGIKSCTGGGTVVLSTEGANQSVPGTAVDNADNSASSSVGSLNIDKTAPTLTGTPTTSANANGWYKGDVTIGWNGADALSGINTATQPANSTITGEGTGLTTSASISDKAGNTTTANSAQVKIDRTAPTTGISGTSNSWTNSNVTVTLAPSDNLSGVASTSYAVDGAATQTGTSFTLSTEGDHTVSYFSTDKAGNIETTRTVHVKIDKTAPTIGHSFTLPGYTDGAWANQDVTVTFVCADSSSGVATCTTPVTKSTEGAAQQVTGTGTDNAGNSATDTALVSIDKTKPTISASTDRPADVGIWYNHSVTVSFSANDALSGLVSTSPAQVLGEGSNQSANGTATDAAGNSASAGVTGINVDVTKPVLAAVFPAGWQTTDVSVTWSCTDALSGVAVAPTNDTVTGEGDNLSSTATCTDKAGNTASETVSGIQIDRTTPTTTAKVPDPLASGWYAGAVEVTLTGHDTLSGVAATHYSVDGGTAQLYAGAFPFSQKGVHALAFWSTDAAGNVEDTTVNSITLKIDGIPPVTTVINPISPASGWFVTSGIPVAFDANDAESGIATTFYQIDGGEAQSYGVPFTADLSTGSHTITYWSVDLAGNVEAKQTTTVSIDNVAPSITGLASPAANGFGWNNTDVSVAFTCVDPQSGVAACGPDTTVGIEGANQQVTGNVKDVAGNTNSTTVDTINIDKTAPTLVGAATTDANEAGWYNGDVTIAWQGHDGLSGINPATKPSNSTITGEGSDLTVTETIADKAGNTTSASSVPVSVDRSAPVTGVSGSSNSWTNGSVTVVLSPSDNLSGVASTSYSVDGGSVQTGTSLTLSSEGDHSVSFFSTDKAGNVEAAQTAHVKIDKTAPSIGHSFTPLAYADGAWSNQDVTVTFACADAGSGVASCTGPVTKSAEGVSQQVTGTATDNAGNAASNTAVVSIDKTAPTISASADRAANGAGWYRDDVTVSFAANDALSGLSSTSPAKVLGEGADQSASGTATDAAGNSASASVSGINVDKTAPVLSAVFSPGWHAGDVVVTWSCTDALSGVAAGPADDTVTGEGGNLSSSATCTDKAGNTASKTVSGIQIDRTTPTTTASIPNAVGGWYKGAVEITLSGDDALSGIGATHYRIDGGDIQSYGGPFSTELATGVHSLTFWSTDVAGNVETQQTTAIKVDNNPPTITGAATPAANGFGWNNTSVDVAFTCGDAESGVAGCGPNATVGTEGANQQVQGDTQDVVGNVNSTTVDHINIDKTAPTLVGAATTDANGADWYNGDVTIAWTGGDALSGIDPSTQPTDSTITGQGNNLGASASISDKAGNQKTATVNGINIDRTAPAIDGGPTTAPNAAGWYRDQVVLDFTCTDSLSGVASCPTSKVIAGDGANQAVTSDPASDKAGNHSAGKTVGGINIDGSAPSTTANNQCITSNGWCTGSSANVVLTATDQAGLSGVKELHYKIDGGAEQVAAGATKTVTVPLDGSGAGTVTYWAVDNAGNTEASNAVALKWDNIAPTLTHTLSPVPNANDWNKSDVTVTFGAKDDDAGSGVANVTAPVTVSTETDGQVIVGSAKDTAGNVGTDAVTVKLDKTAPTIGGAVVSGTLGANGWYVGPVTVHFTCADARSGVATCPDNVILTANGTNSASGTVTDKAGNTAATTVSGINIDKEAPSITGVNVAGGLYTLGAVPAPTCTASDSFSGLSGSCVVSISGGNANGVGTFSYTARATDKAGNTGTATGTYRVIYRFDGFLQPINDTAHQVGTSTSIFKGGSTVPVKFQLKNASGTVVQANAAPVWLTPAKGASMSLPVDESLYSAAADSGSTFRYETPQYTYNWKTTASGNYYRIGVTLDDGQTYYVNIGLR